MYGVGKGVTKDASKAVYWFQKAANQGDATAQYNLGVMYAAGEGVTKDEVEALSWFYIAKSNGEEVKNIYTIENHLGSIGTLLAQKRAREISEKISSQKSGVPIDMPEKDVAGNEVNKSYSSSGSGVFVSADGLLLTAAHVITGANEIKIVTVNGVVQADIVQIDKANDVAMLRCKGNFKAARVINSRVVRLGQDVFTIGFPQITLQGFNHKFTDGKISSLSGAHDDPREWQISIPVQPGNSGGPLFDVNGNLVGIVVSKLNELEVAKETGNLPQNVNYALKSAYIRPLLEENGVEISEPFKTAAKLEDVVAKALHSVALVLCYE
jgi:S1-C subfamily serine protease